LPVLALPRGGTKEDNRNKRIAVLGSIIAKIFILTILQHIIKLEENTLLHIINLKN